MDVLEHEQQRAASAGTRQEIRHRGVEPVALGVGVRADRVRQAADARREIGQQAAELAAHPTEVGAQHLGVGGPRELIERLGERPVGCLHHGVAGAVEDEHVLGRHLARELPHEAALAGTRLAPYERQAPALGGLAREQRAQRRELGGAPDERERRRQRQRSGQRAQGRPPV